MMHPLIAAALAAPKTHKCVTLYADGTSREHLTRSEATAKNFAISERRKIGRDYLISRETGNVMSVIDVYVARI